MAAASGTPPKAPICHDLVRPVDFSAADSDPQLSGQRVKSPHERTANIVFQRKAAHGRGGPFFELVAYDRGLTLPATHSRKGVSSKLDLYTENVARPFNEPFKNSLPIGESTWPVF